MAVLIWMKTGNHIQVATPEMTLGEWQMWYQESVFTEQNPSILVTDIQTASIIVTDMTGRKFLVPSRSIDRIQELRAK